MTSEKKANLPEQDRIRKESQRQTICRKGERMREAQLKRNKQHPTTNYDAIRKFWLHKSASTIYQCTCCYRQLYQESVLRFSKEVQYII